MKAQRDRKAFIPLAFFFAMTLLFCATASVCAQAAKDALWQCTSRLLPALFPLMTASHFFVASGSCACLARYCAFPAKLLGASRTVTSLFFCGIISGFPGGAAALAQACREKQIEKEEAQALAGLCNLPSPGFYLNFVGAALYQKPIYGLLLFAAHLLSAFLLLPLVTGTYDEDEIVVPPYSGLFAALCKSIAAAGQSCLCICSFVVFFSVICAGTAKLFPMVPARLHALICAVLELGSGTVLLSAQNPPLPLMASVCGFSGFSVFMQVQNTLPSGVSMRPYFLQKLLQAVLCPAFVLLFAQGTPLLLRLPGLSFAFVLLFLRILKQKKPFPHKRKGLPVCKKSSETQSSTGISC